MNTSKQERRHAALFSPQLRKSNQHSSSTSNKPKSPKSPFTATELDIIDHDFNDLIELNSLYLSIGSQPRVIFISFVYLAKNWHRIPFRVLYNSIFFFPSLKRSAIFPDTMDDYLQSQRTFLPKMKLCDVFLAFLIKKEEQNLVIYKPEDEDVLEYRRCLRMKNIVKLGRFHTYYRMFSEKLSTIIDPMTKERYNPININPQWWSTLSPNKLKYAKDIESITHELCSAEMKFRPLLDIIRLSNSTLLPIVEWKSEQKYKQSIHRLMRNHSKPFLTLSDFSSTSSDGPSVAPPKPTKRDMSQSGVQTNAKNDDSNDGFTYIDEYTDPQSGFSYLIYSDDDEDNTNANHTNIQS